MAVEQLSSEIDLTGLYDLADQIAGLYRRNIEKAGAVASGRLKNFTWDFTYQQHSLVLTFFLPEYWRWVEEGRGATVNSTGWGGYPVSVPDIERWMQVKNIVPRAGSDGKVPTTRQVAYAIVNKIHREGYDGRHPLYNTVKGEEGKALIDKIMHSVVDALGREINVALIQFQES